MAKHTHKFEILGRDEYDSTISKIYIFCECGEFREVKPKEKKHYK